MAGQRRALPVLRLPRPVWLALGLGSGAAAVLVAGPLILVLWLAPDLALLAGGLHSFDSTGRLHPRAIRAYNAAHVLAGPGVLALLAVAFAPGLLALAAIWLSHIAIDRALGYYPRDASGRSRSG